MRSLPEQTVEMWGGMECTINRVENDYFDQFDHSGHRDRDGDIELFAGLGLKKMRYPILWEHHQPKKNNYIDWQETDRQLQALKNPGVGIIAGLVHHGSGPDFVEIMEDSFAIGLAAYATEVAARYPWIEYYTPVNEPLTTARFCGLYGLWYPHEKNDQSFCRILVNECKATIMAMMAIRLINPAAKLVQTDDLAKVHNSPALQYQADFENERRWLSYDLLCGKVDADHALWKYLTEHGITAAELGYFLANPCPPDIFGANYYLTSERYLDEDLDEYPVHSHGGNGRHVYADVEAVRVGKICPDGLGQLLKAAWERYHIPLAVTEVHLHCTREEQMRWLKDVWEIANCLRNDGVPILAITAWALLGSFGWDRLLTRSGGTYEPGVYDLSSGKPRPTILAQMIRAYSQNQEFCHPVLESPGWWQRNCRSTFGKDQFFSSPSLPGQMLNITGFHAAAVSEVCRARCLSLPLNITANEYLEINGAGTELVIRLTPANLYGDLNGALDLFLDGESGYWEKSTQGTWLKQHAPLQLFAG